MRTIWVLDKENPKVTCSYIQYRTDNLNLYRIVQSLEVLIEIDLSTMNSNYSRNSLRSIHLLLGNYLRLNQLLVTLFSCFFSEILLKTSTSVP